MPASKSSRKGLIILSYQRHKKRSDDQVRFESNQENGSWKRVERVKGIQKRQRGYGMKRGRWKWVLEGK